MTTLNNANGETESVGESDWVPLGLDDSELDDYYAGRDDIPEYLETSLWKWIDKQLLSSSGTFKPDLVRKAERVLRMSIPVEHVQDYPRRKLQAVRSAYSSRPDIEVWRFVDFLLAEDDSFYADGRRTSLDEMLVQAGSGWQVGSRRGKPGLVQRLPDGVGVAAKATFQHPDAGKRLAAAWETVFGIDPDPSKGYSLAVKAVEDAAIPVVCPNDRTATLGKVIGVVNGGTWRLPHLREDPASPTHDVLVGMMRTLWVGQHDRHGGPSTVDVPAVTQAEAESAVMLAVALVGWFETGKVQQ